MLPHWMANGQESNLVPFQAEPGDVEALTGAQAKPRAGGRGDQIVRSIRISTVAFSDPLGSATPRRHMVIMLGSALVIAARRARAHGGGRDKLGCYHDRKNGGYHCHTGKLAEQSFPSKASCP
jgi:hypothetical protein